MALPVVGIGALSAIPLLPAQFPTATQPFLQIGIVTGVCNGATPVTVAFTALTATSAIIPYLSVVGGTVGAAPVVQTRTAGTGFTFQGTASDTSTYGFLIVG